MHSSLYIRDHCTYTMLPMYLLTFWRHVLETTRISLKDLFILQPIHKVQLYGRFTQIYLEIIQDNLFTHSHEST